MSTLWRLSWSSVELICKPGTRLKWSRRGVRPENAKSLAQNLAEWNYKDPELYYKVNIGYTLPTTQRKVMVHERLKIRKEIKENLELEKSAKKGTLEVRLEDVESERSLTNKPLHLQQAAEYFNLYDDLFGDAYFSPVVPLNIEFSVVSKGEEVVSQVHAGNQITPFEAKSKPSVTYPVKNSDSYYTLALTTPDCHYSGEPKEYLHWLVCNLPGNDFTKGETLCDYIQPFPVRGTGYSRYAFVLYKQEKKLDFSQYRRSPGCTSLVERTFSTYDFYREFQDNMTPAGLAFFQSNWDQSLTDFYHNVLAMKEPSFEYDVKDYPLKPQKWFPIRQPFNLYMDKYKDSKVLQKELLLEKLKERHPFKPPPPPPKYPHAHPISLELPQWLRDDIKRKRAKEGKWRFM